MASTTESKAAATHNSGSQSGDGRATGNFDGSRGGQGGRGRGGFGRGGNRGGYFSPKRPFENSSRGQGGGDYGGQSEQELKALTEKLAIFDTTAGGFVALSKQLDERNDRFERCVRISRDVTIESKRIIYQLQRLAGLTDLRSRTSILNSVNDRLHALVDDKLKQLHAELLAGITGIKQLDSPVESNVENKDDIDTLVSGSAGKDYASLNPLPSVQSTDRLDHHYYARAFSPGVQEFVEALTLCHFLRTGKLMKLSEVRDFVSCRFPVPRRHELAHGTAEEKECRVDLISASDYLLGIFDLPGELNRIAVVEAGNTGDRSRLEPICLLLQRLYTVTKGLKVPRDISRTFQFKMKVLKTSLDKVEKIIYELAWRKYDGLPLVGCGDVLLMQEGGQAPQQASSGSMDAEGGAAAAVA